jgi:nucleoside-diphosphate-sugar epimerase
MTGGGPALVTGAGGCIGAWVVRDLLDRGREVVAFDLPGDRHRLRLLLSDDELSSLRFVDGDITDLAALERVLDRERIRSVIHLAALQVPFCRADPPLGGMVNVVGTLNVFEAVRRSSHSDGQVVYASSIAAYDAIEAGSPAVAEMRALPSTIYGVTKRANEGTAHVYWLDHGISSIGLRPHTVFGPGRDQGLTSAPTAAMLAAAAGSGAHIPYGGRAQLQYGPDVASVFVAAAESARRGATVHNLAGHLVSMDDVIDAIERAAPEVAGTITYDAATVLPFPEEVDSASLDDVIGPQSGATFTDAVADAVERFRNLLGRGLVEAPPPVDMTASAG